MNFSSIGDLASTFLLQKSGVSARQQLSVLGKELTTGLTADTRSYVRGDLTTVADIERQIESAQVREKTLVEELARSSAQDAVIESLRTMTVDLANDGELSKDAELPGALERFSRVAAESIAQSISSLNISVAGQSLFAGSNVNGPAFADIDVIMDSLRTSISGSITATDVINGVDSWMSDPINGFGGVAFTGDSLSVRKVRLSQNRQIDVPASANEPGIQQMFRSLAIAALSDDATLSLSNQAKKHLVSESTLGLRKAHYNLTDFQAEVGYGQSQIIRAQTQASAEISTASQLKLSILGVDEYETASMFQSTEMQLEKIYTLTARSARMSLLEYLR